jgi:predicted NAD/FAD-dependent oxidoreductase
LVEPLPGVPSIVTAPGASIAAVTLPAASETLLKPVNPAPLPVNVPEIWFAGFVAMTVLAKVFVPVKRFVPFNRTIFVDNCASEIAPVKFSAFVAVPANVALVALPAVTAVVALVAVVAVVAEAAVPAIAAVVAVPALPVMLMFAVPAPMPLAGTLAAEPAVLAVVALAAKLALLAVAE